MFGSLDLVPVALHVRVVWCYLGTSLHITSSVLRGHISI